VRLTNRLSLFFLTALALVLIGPPCAGKSTIGRLLAIALGVPLASPDTGIAWKYYEELGYDAAVADQIWNEEGFKGLERYGEPYGAAVIARLLTDYAGCVIDFGAGRPCARRSAPCDSG